MNTGQVWLLHIKCSLQMVIILAVRVNNSSYGERMRNSLFWSEGTLVVKVKGDTS